MSFDEGTYDTIRRGIQESAAVIVPMLMETFDPHLVLDVGCGEGWWLREFAKYGVSGEGVDGGIVPPSTDTIRFHAADLEGDPLPRFEGFSMALCLEVLEHLSPAAGDRVVEMLCKAAPLVVFSAAIPGQGGHQHVNEQWPAYWIERFQLRKYMTSASLRWRIWTDARVEPWYRQNLLVASCMPSLWPGVFRSPLAPTWPVVHPDIFRWKTGL